jgi:hypothetical protein
MKRASLVAPLLLIAVGALFLARNLYPELPLYDYIARFWPYVLILWGALRVIEILYWANTSKPLPARGISGGEWVLIVLLCLVGMGMHTARTFVWEWPGRIPWSGVRVIGERFDYPVSAERATSKAPRVEIEDFHGDVQITGSDADEVKVTGRKSVRALDKDQADQADRNSSVEITGDASEIRVRLRTPNGFGPEVSASLEIAVPKGASVEAKRRDGDVHIGNVAGAVAVSGRAVNLDVHAVSGPVTIEGAYTGEVALKNLAKTVRFKSQRTEFSAAAVPGEIHLDAGNLSADGLTGPAELHSRSRDVKLRDFREPLEIDLERGDLHLEPMRVPLARIEAKVRSGDVAIVLPEAAAFSIRATTKNGEITNGLGPGFRVNSEGRRETLEGASGSGPRIVVESERGSISVSRGSSVKDTAQPLETIHQ